MLDEHEKLEEKDRLAHGSVKNEGKRKRAAPKKKVGDDNKT